LAIQFTTLFSFSGSDGSGPTAGLTADSNGNLFGTTYQGGASNAGTVFEIKNTGTVAEPVYAGAPTTLVSFDGYNGALPYGGLTVDANGDLLGTTERGGTSRGMVFEIKNTGTVAEPVYAGAPTTLVSFDGDNGAFPEAGLITDANGDLFGTTQSSFVNGMYGTGRVFEIENSGTVTAPVYLNAPTTLISFGGQNPYAGLVADANGNLLGTIAMTATTAVAWCSRSRISARSQPQSTRAPRPDWSPSTAPTAKVPLPD
jgi:uncharacterized repeat protein (TIGR03803 family)